MEIVTKEEYWTTILNDYSQFGQITTEDSEFNSIANDVWNVLENSFIKIDDEESVIKWEEMAGLSSEGLTLSQRKANVLHTLTVKNYLPISLFTQAMSRLVGEDNYIITFNEETQKYEVECYEDYETSASFLNKRLANECINLEISPLPTGYIKAEFLDSTGVEYIDPLHVPTRNFGYEIKATAPLIAGKNGFIWGCQTEPGTKRLWGQCRSDGQFEIGWNTKTVLIPYVPNKQTIKMNFLGSKACFVDNDKVQDLWSMGFDPMLHFTLFKSTYKTNTSFDSPVCASRIFNAKFSENGDIVRDLVCAIDSQGTPCMYDSVTKQPFYNNGSGSLIVGLTTSQTRQLNKLPVTETGMLTLSLPWEAQLVITGVSTALQVAANRGWTITVQYRDPEVDNMYYNKYVTCKTVADMVAVNPDYRNDLTTDGEWVYPLPELTSVPMTTATGQWWFRYSPIKKIDIELPKLTQGQYLFRGSAMEEARVSLPLLTTDQRSMFENCPLRVAYVNAPNLTNLSALFASTQMEEITEENLNVGEAYDISYIALNTPKLRRFAFHCLQVTTANYAFIGCNNLTSFESELPKLSSGTVMFQDCQLNKESALRVLTSIPTWTDGAAHPITMGIHIDNKNDEEVLAAIENAKNKGWTVVTQWRGTATTQGASTFAMRKPTIYAKLGTMELPDGTIETFLDWGHYVTNWTENGYQEFSSIEEANEYFNIENETEQ